jgi:hypothetical protein
MQKHIEDSKTKNIGHSDSGIDVAAQRNVATKTVHWPTGPVNCCDDHAAQLVGLGNYLGSYIAVTAAPYGSECGNCKNSQG